MVLSRTVEVQAHDKGRNTSKRMLVVIIIYDMLRIGNRLKSNIDLNIILDSGLSKLS